jgi:hypothetical protein
LKSRLTKHKSTKEKPFPKLVIAHNLGPVMGNDVIVSMHEAGKGQVMHVSKPEEYNRKLGDYYTDWEMKTFEDFNGKVTLQNS